MLSDIDPAMFLGSLLLVSSLAHLAMSAVINSKPTSLNWIRPHCFTPETDPSIQPIVLDECRTALNLLAHNPDFTTPHSYSKNPLRGRPLPLGWKFRDCLILASCENERDALIFRFADVLVSAKRLVDTCVGTERTEKWGLLRWGGVDNLRDSLTFFVSVIKFRPEAVNGGEDFMAVELVNGTQLLVPAIENS